MSGLLLLLLGSSRNMLTKTYTNRSTTPEEEEEEEEDGLYVCTPNSQQCESACTCVMHPCMAQSLPPARAILVLSGDQSGHVVLPSLRRGSKPTRDRIS
ncbi:hypothetical protein L249_4107 [Ophiocordyceps polyrhachis-furcata BCC 54312]|uniref:Secreted protein n=1 Tax=Ophiocordyceps polyrhachis-furcata BCC 54312 TaxID=1330021 RepID=A0A367L562_9HYPO|nr:hypothetical protein L249_4107 [Ophiocordyceps polyrhachis-furcata BCC 54312]